MKAAVLEDTGRVVVQDVDDLQIEPTELLIRVSYAGVCGSDLHAFDGSHPFRRPPVVLGHELSGIVERVGSEARGHQVGDRVTVMPYLSCGHCLACRRGRTNVCENKVVPGIGGWQGTFADYFVAKPEITYALGRHTTLKRGVLAEPLAVAVHSVRQGRVGLDSSVLILGGGTIGLLTAVAAAKAGAKCVAITDLYDYNLGVAQEMGFAAYSATDPDLEGTLAARYPERFEVVFLTSGAPVTVGLGVRLAQRAGRIVGTAIFGAPVTFPIMDLTLFEKELIGTQIYTDQDFREALAWLDAGGVPFDSLIDHAYPLASAQFALELLAQRTRGAIKIVLKPGE